MTKARRRDDVTLLGAVRRSRAALAASTALQAGVLLALALPAAAQPAPNARPTGGSVVAGSATIGQTATTTTIDQTSQRAAVNWQGFNVGSQQTVTFDQPSSSAITLNRVIGPDPSQIAGHIDANGQVVLVNQSGVVFYQGSQVDVAGLMVSAPGITNQHFMKGQLVFDQPAKANAIVANRGSITIKQAGLAALVAPQVANSGVINANLGHVVLAGAKTATLDLYGDGLLSLNVTNAVTQVPVGPNGKTATALVTNTGTILADGGTVQLTARAADGLLQNLVRSGGTIRAATVGTQAGSVALNAIGGSLVIDGQLAATGDAPGTSGGAIVANATGNVTVGAHATVNASGEAGGGVVAIGTTLARAKGGPSVKSTQTARNVTVQAGAVIAADATGDGAGGRVALLSRHTTQMDGSISVTGGPQGGDGGFIEVSGHYLGMLGPIALSAPLGAPGSVLLDPLNLDIVAGAGGSGSEDGNFATNGGTVVVGDGLTGTPDTISNGVIDAAGGNVLLQALQSITVTAPIDVTKGSLTLQAGSFLVAGDFGVGVITVNGGVSMTAAGDVVLQTGGFAISSLASPLISILGSVRSTGGSVSLLAGTNGIINIGAAGSVTAASGQRVTLQTDTLTVAAGAAITVPSGTVEIAPASLNDVLVGSTAFPLGVTQSVFDAISAGTVELGAVTVGGVSTITAEGIVFAGSASILPGAQTLVLNAEGEVREGPAVVVAAGTLIGNTGPVFLATSTLNEIGTVGSFSVFSGSDFNLAVTGSTTLAGPINANDISVSATGAAINVTGPVIATPTVIDGGTFVGSVSLTSGGTIAIESGGNVQGTTITLSAVTGIGLSGTGSLGNTTALVDMSTAGGGVIEDGTATLAAGGLTSSGGVTGNVSLLGTNNAVLEVASFIVSAGSPAPGNFQMNDAFGLVVGGVGIRTPAGNVYLEDSTSDGIALDAPVVTVAGGLASFKTDVFVLLKGGVVNTGTFELAPDTPFFDMQIGAGGAPADLINILSTMVRLGAVTEPGDATPTTTAGAITVVGTFDALGRTLELDSLGLITGTAAPLVNVGTLIAYGTTIDLNNPSNIVTNLGNVLANSFTLQDSTGLTVVGAVGASSDATITSTGFLTVDGAVAAPAISLTSGVITIAGTVSSDPAGTVGLFATTDAISETGVLIAGTLTGSATGAAVFTGATPTSNQIGTLGNFSAGSLTLETAGDLTVAGPVSGGTFLTISDAGTLSVTGSVAATTVILFTSAGDLTVAGGATVAGTTVALSASPGVLTIDGTVDASTAATLSGAAGIAGATGLVTGDGALSADSSGGAVDLSNPANAVASISGSAFGSFVLADGTALTVDSVTAGTIANLSAPITTLAGTVTAPTVALTASTGALDVNGTVNASTAATLSGAAGIAGAAGLVIGDGALSASSSGGSVDLSNPLNAVASVSGTAFASFAFGDGAALTVNDVTAGTTATLSAPTTTLAGTVTAPTVSLTAGTGALTVDGTVNASTAATLAGAAGIAGATGLVTGDGALSASSSGGAVDLSNPANAVANVGGTAFGAFTLADSTALTVNSVTAGTIATLSAPTTTVAGIVTAPTVALTAGTGALTVDGTVNASTAATLAGAAGIAGATGLVTGDGALSASSSGGAVDLSNPANAVAGVSGSAFAGFVLADSAALTINTVTAGTSATLSAPTATVAGTVTAPTVALTAGTGALTVDGTVNASTAATLSGAAGIAGATGLVTGDGALNASSSGGAVDLSNPANAVASVSGTAFGAFALADGTGLTVGSVTAGTTATLSAPTATVAGTVTAPTVALTASTGALTINGTVNGSTAATLSGAAGIAGATGVVSGDGALSASSSGGAVDLSNPANAVANVGGTAFGAFTLADGTGLTVGSVTAGTTATLSAPTATVAGVVTAPTVALTASTGALTVTGTVNASTAATLAGAAGIAGATGVVSGDGALSASSSGGSVDLGNTANAIASVAGTAFGSFVIADSSALTVNTVTAGSAATLTAPTTTLVGTVTAPTVALTASTGVLAINGTVNASTAATLSGAAGIAGGTGLVTGDGALNASSSGGPVDLSNPANAVATVSGTAFGSFALADSAALTVNSVTAGTTATLTAPTLTATGIVTAPTVALTASTGALDLNGTVNASTAATLSGAAGIAGAAGLVAGDGALSANSSGGAVDLSNPANAVASVSGTALGSFALGDSAALTVNTVTAGTSAALTAPATTLAGTVTAPTVALTASTGALTVDGTVNASTAAALSGAAGIAGATGLVTGDGALNASSSGGAVDLSNPANAVANVGGTAFGAFTLADSTALTVNSVTAGTTATLSAPTTTVAGIVTAPTVALTASTGALTVDGTVSASTAATLAGAAGIAGATGLVTGDGALSASSSGGAVDLSNPANAVANVGGTAFGAFTLADGTGLTVGSVTAGTTATLSAPTTTVAGIVTAPTVALTASTGALTVTGTVDASTAATLAGATGIAGASGVITGDGALSASSSGGAVDLSNPANAVANVSGTAFGAFALADGTGLTVGSVTAGTTATLSAPTATVAGIVTAPTVALTAGTGALTVTGTVNASTAATLAGAAGIAGATGLVAGDGALSASSSGGAVDLGNTANAVASVSGTAFGAFVLADGSALTVNTVTAGTSATLSAPTTTVAGVVTAPTVVLTASTGALDVNGTVNASTAATLSGAASIAGGAGLVIGDGALSANSSGGSVDLSNPLNAVASVGGTARGSFGLGDSAPLTVNTVTAGTRAALTAPTTTLAGTVTAPSVALTASTGALTLNGTVDASTAATLAGAAGIAGSTGVVIGDGGLSADSSGGAVNLSNPANAVASISGAALGSFVLADGAALTVNTVTAGTAATLSAPTTTVAGIVTAPTIALTSTVGDMTVSGSIGGTAISLSGANVTVGGAVNAGATGTVALVATAGTIGETGTLTAGTLSGSAIGAVSLSGGGNDFATLGAFTAGGDLAVTDAAALTVVGAVSAGGVAAPNPRNTATLSLSAAALQIGAPGAPGSLNGGTVALAAAGPISEPNGTVAANTFAASTSAAGDIVLANAANRITASTGITAASGQVVLVDDPTVTLSGPYSGSNLFFEVTAPGGTLAIGGASPASLTVPTLGRITLVADAMTATAASTITAPLGTLQLAPFSATRETVLGSSTSGLLINATLLGDISGGEGALGTLEIGAFTDVVVGVSAGGTATVVSASAIALDGPIDLTATAGSLELLANGPITQPAGTLAVADVFGATGGAGGDFSLTSAGNAITNSTGITATAGNVVLVDGGNLTLVNAFSGNNLFFEVAAPGGTLSLGTGGVVPVPATVTTAPGDRASLVADTIICLDASPVTATGGTVELSPFSAINASLFGSTGWVADPTLLANLTASALTVGGFTDLPAGATTPTARASSVSVDGPADFTGIVTTLQLLATGSISEPGGPLTVATLTGSGSGISLLNPANAIGTLGALSATGGNLALADASAMSIAGAVTATGNLYLATPAAGGIAVAATGSLGASAAGRLSLQAGKLSIAAGGAAGGGTLEFAPDGAGKTVLLGPGGSLVSLAGITTSAVRIGAVTLPGAATPTTIAAAIATTGAFDATGLPVELEATGAITGTAGPLVNVSTLSGSGGNWTLTSANVITALGNIAAANFDLADTHDLTVAGALAAGAGATIVDTGSLAVSGSVAATAISLSGASLTIPGTVNAGAGGTISLVASAGAINETGTLVAGTLTGSATGAANLAGATPTTNQVATLGDFTAGSFALDDGGNLLVSGVVDAPAVKLSAASETIPGTVNAGAGGTVNLIATGGPITETGTLIAGTLTGSAAGAANLAGATPAANQVATLGNFSAAGFTLDTGGNLAVSGAVGGGTAATIVDGGALTVSGSVGATAISLTGGNLAIAGSVSAGGSINLAATGGAITETGTLTAGTLTGTATGAANLAGATPTTNRVAALGNFSAGSFTLDDGSNLLVSGVVDAPAVNLSAASETIPGTINAGAGGTANLVAATGAIDETGTLIAGTLTGSAAGAASLNGATTSSNQVATLGNFTAASFALQTGGDLLVSGAVSAGSAATILAGGDLTVAGSIVATSIGLTANNVTIPGLVQDPAGGTVDLVASTGTINETGTLIAGTLIGSAFGAANLAGASPTANQVATLGDFSAASFLLRDGADLVIAGTLAAPDISVLAPANQITLGNGATIETSGTTPTSGPIPPAYEPASGAPGAYLQAASFVQLGTSTVTAGTSGPSTLQISVTGNIGFDPAAGLQATGATLILDLTNGAATGNAFVAALDVSYTTPGSATLFGTIAGISGPTAALAGFITPAASPLYVFNGCEIAAVSCFPVVKPITPAKTPSGLPGEPVALPHLAEVPLFYFLRDLSPQALVTPNDKDDLLQLPVVSEQDY